MEEAKRRGLPNYRTAVDVYPCYVAKKNIDVLTKHNVFSETEIRSRCDILIEEYSKTVNIEARTMLQMAKREIMPAAIKYSRELCESIKIKNELCLKPTAEIKQNNMLSSLINRLDETIDKLNYELDERKSVLDIETAVFFKDTIIPIMSEMRAISDEMETMIPDSYWPFPTYSELLFNL